MKRSLLIILFLTILFLPIPSAHAYDAKTLPDGSVAVTDLMTGHTTISPQATLASYATYPRPSSLSNLQYRQVIEIENPSSVSMTRPVEVTLDLHDVAYRTTLVLTDSSGNVIPFQVLSYTDSDGDGRLEETTILFIANVPAGGSSIFFLYYDNKDKSTPIHNTQKDYVNEIYGLTAQFNTRSLTSSGSLSSQRTGISVSRDPIYQNDDTFGDSSGSSSTVIGAKITVTVGTYRFIIYASPKFIHNGEFDYDNDGYTETADAYTFREGLQVIQYRDGSKRVDIVRYEPVFSQGTGGSYGYTVDIFSPFVFESHAFVLDTDNDGDVGDASDPSSADPSALHSYTDPGNPYTIHIDEVSITLGPVMISIDGQAFAVPMNVICKNGAVGRNDYENFSPHFSLNELVSYVFYYNLPYVKLHRKLINAGSSSVRISDSYSFMNTQPLLHHTNFTDTALINDPIGYPGDTTSDAATFFQIHTRYDIDNVPPYTGVDIARPRAYGLADILGTSPSEKYVYLGRSSDAPNRDSSYPPAIIGMILLKSAASGLKRPSGEAISDPFQTFYSRSITYGRIYSATSNWYDTDGQYATASIGLVKTNNTGLLLDSNGYIEGEILYAIFYGNSATPTQVANVKNIAFNSPSVSNDPSGPAARESKYNLTVKFVDYQGDPISGASVRVSYSGTEITTVNTDTDGAIILKLGANGTYSLTISYDTVMGTFVEKFNVSRTVNGSNPEVTLTAAIQDIDVFIKYPDNSPADGVVLTVYGENSSYTGQTTEKLLYNVTLSNGYYHVENLPEGSYRFVITKYIGPIKVYEEHVVKVNATQYSFTYYLDVAKLSVSVKDPDGAPIVGASVTVEEYNGTEYVTVYTGTTDTSGLVSFVRVPMTNQTDNQPVRVRASYTVYGVTCSEYTTLTLSSDSSTSITLALYDLTLTIYDSENVPADNGTIVVTITYADGQNASFSYSSYTFTIENLPSASYTSNNTIKIEVTYTVAGVSASATDTETFTSDVSATIKVPDVWTVYFKVGYYDLSSNRVPLSGATVEIYSPTGDKIPVKLTTNDTGYAVLHGLPKATGYEAHATYSFYGVSVVHVRSFDNNVTKEVVEIAYDVVQIDVFVHAISGEIVSGAVVDVYYGDTLMVEINTGSDGHARYFPFPSSSYIDTSLVKIHVSYTTYGRLVEKEVAGIDRNSPIDIALGLGRIDGSVSLADGRTNVPVKVSVYEVTAGKYVPVTETKAVGTFSITMLPTGHTYLVSVSYTTSYGYDVTTNSSTTLTNVTTLTFNIPVGTVGVHVLDKENNPVSGASVIGRFGPIETTVSTDSNGYAYFTDVPLSEYVGDVTFEARYTIFGIVVSSSKSVSVTNGTVVTITLNIGHTSVKVKDLDGNYLSGATVTITIGSVSKSSTTDSSGVATFYVPYGISASISASYTAINGVSASASDNVTTSSAPVEISVPLGTIYVNVYDQENNAVSGAYVTVEIGSIHLKEATGSAGNVSFYVSIGVKATISAKDPEFGMSSSMNVTLSLGARYNITLPLGHITVIVQDAEHAALSGIPVTIKMLSFSIQKTTDTNGRATFYVPILVNATITAEYKDFGISESIHVNVSVGGEYSITLPIAHVYAKVTDYENSPIAGATVVLEVDKISMKQDTNSTGYATFYAPIDRNATLTATDPEFGMSSSMNVTLSKKTVYNITLPLGHITVIVQDAEHAALSGVPVTVNTLSFSIQKTTDTNGRATFYIPVGYNATITAEYSDLSVSETMSSVTSAGDEYTITLPIAHVYVKVTDYENSPIAGATVILGIGTLTLSHDTNSTGYATFYAPIGTNSSIKATYSFSGIPISVTEYHVLEAKNVYHIAIPLGHVHIKALTYDGHPIPNSDVYIDVGSIRITGVTGDDGIATIYSIVNVTASVTVYFETFDVYTVQSVYLVAGQTYAFYLPLSRVTFIVMDYEGNLLSGAKVSMDILNYHYEGSTTDGKIDIPTIVNATATVTVSYKTIYGFVLTTTESIDLEPNGTYTIIIPMASLTVHVSDALGEPIAAAKVSLAYQGTIFVSAPTDSNGSVRIIQVPVGYALAFNVTYDTPYGVSVKYFEFITLEGPLEKSVTLQMGEATLKFTDLTGKGVNGIKLSIKAPNGFITSYSVPVSNITLSRFPIGVPFNLTAEYTSYGILVYKTTTLSLGAASESYTIALPMKPMKILIVDLSNRPVPMAKVTLSYESVGTFYSDQILSGELDLDEFPVASYLGSLTISASYLSSLGVEVEGRAVIDTPATYDTINVKMPMKMVRIVVTDVNNEPTLATVYIKGISGLGTIALTASNGSVTINDFPLSLSPANITAVRIIYGDNGVALTIKNTVVVDFSSTSEAKVTLQLTDLDIVVTDKNGNPLEGAIVTITAGNLMFKTTTDARGVAHFEDIPTLTYIGASEYKVEIDYGGVKTETTIAQSGGEFEVKAKTPADVQKQRLIAAVVITAAVAGFVAYKFVIKARPPYYRLKKAIAKGAEEIDLERLPTRDEELLEIFESVEE